MPVTRKVPALANLTSEVSAPPGFVQTELGAAGPARVEAFQARCPALAFAEQLVPSNVTVILGFEPLALAIQHTGLPAGAAAAAAAGPRLCIGRAVTEAPSGTRPGPGRLHYSDAGTGIAVRVALAVTSP